MMQQLFEKVLKYKIRFLIIFLLGMVLIRLYSRFSQCTPKDVSSPPLTKVEEKAVEEKAVEVGAVEEKAVEEKAVEEKAVEEKAVEAGVVEVETVEEINGTVSTF